MSAEHATDHDVRRRAREFVDSASDCYAGCLHHHCDRIEPVELVRGLLAELDRAESIYRWLAAELCYEYDAILMRQGSLLTDTVNMLKGDPPPLTTWSHHDVAELAEGIIAERDAALSTLQKVRESLPELLDAAWDDGNASGLDGWIGPGRGAGEVDEYAVAQRRRSTERLVARILDGGAQQ